MRPHSLDDLRRVIRRIEGRRPPRVAPEAAEHVLGGEVVETDAGAILVVRRDYPLGHRHGRRALAGVTRTPADLVRLLARSEGMAPDPRRFLFLDTETTGLAGGTGTYAFLVGAGYVDGERFIVAQYFMRDLDEEPALLAALAPILERASAIVSFNGRGFDLPLLETRFVLARRPWPATLIHVDLLCPARRVWGPAFEDCRLASLERSVLGVVRDDDVPGAFIPSLYFAFLRSRQPAPLARIFAHNRDDVLSLAALLAWFADAEGATDCAAHELAGLGALWDGVDIERSVALYRAALEAGLGGPLAQRVGWRLAWWEKRRARWEHACALWELATRGERFDHRPWEELAKFHEHRRRDADAARLIVTRALERAAAAAAPGAVVAAFRYRLARLETRLARSRSRPAAGHITTPV
jgi:uncharacterized protein YprB with RNaseH-like and TPR domain